MNELKEPGNWLHLEILTMALQPTGSELYIKPMVPKTIILSILKKEKSARASSLFLF
jgi:hypothetical protein